MALIVEERDIPMKHSLSSSIEPKRYRIDIETKYDSETDVLNIDGLVIAEFQKNGNNHVEKLVLMARNMTISKYRLVMIDKFKDNGKRRKRNNEGESNSENFSIIYF